MGENCIYILARQSSIHVCMYVCMHCQAAYVAYIACPIPLIHKVATCIKPSLFFSRSTENVLFGQDYCDKFNPQDYLQTYSVANLGPLHLLRLKELLQFYQSYPPTAKLRILDIGSGPSIANSISAAPHAAEIILSEYTEANRSTLLQWLNSDPNAFDCTHVFKHVVVDLEGKPAKEIQTRADLVRKVVKAVVPCDVTQDPPIPTEYVDEYDIVTEFLCLTAACATKEDYKAALVRLHALLKSGGKIVLYTVHCKDAPTNASYSVGPHNFFELRISEDFIFKSLEEAGFCDVKVIAWRREDLNLPDDMFPDFASFSFITASKLKQKLSSC